MQPKAAGFPWSCGLITLALLLRPSAALGAQDAEPSPAIPTGPADAAPAQPPAAPAGAIAPKVVHLKGNLELDDLIWLQVDGLKEWSKENDAGKLVPYIDGRAIGGNYPDEIQSARNLLSYHLEISPENRETWSDLLGAPSGIRKPV